MKVSKGKEIVSQISGEWMVKVSKGKEIVSQTLFHNHGMEGQRD